MSSETSIIVAITAFTLIWPIAPAFTGIGPAGKTRLGGHHTFIPALMAGAIILATGNVISWNEAGDILLYLVAISGGLLAASYTWKAKESSIGVRIFFSSLVFLVVSFLTFFILGLFLLASAGA